LAAQPCRKHEAVDARQPLGDLTSVRFELLPGTGGLFRIEAGLSEQVLAVVDRLRHLIKWHRVEPVIVGAEHLHDFGLHALDGAGILRDHVVERPAEPLVDVVEILPEVDVEHVRRGVPRHRHKEAGFGSLADQLQTAGIDHAHVRVAAVELIEDGPPGHLAGVCRFSRGDSLPWPRHHADGDRLGAGHRRKQGHEKEKEPAHGAVRDYEKGGP